MRVLPLATDVGNYVSYTCEEGYLFIDGSEMNKLVCNNSRQWTGIIPDCTGDVIRLLLPT